MTGTLRRLHPNLVGILLVSLLFLNLADAICTYTAVIKGGVAEANPLMAWLIEIHTYLFLAVKAAIGPVVFVILWCYRNKRPLLVGYGTVLVVTVYTFVCGWHLYGLLASGLIPGVEVSL